MRFAYEMYLPARPRTEPRPFIIGEHGSAVRAEAGVDDPFGPFPEDGDRSPRSRIPEPGGEIVATAQQRPTIRADVELNHRLPIVGDRRQKPSAVVLAGGENGSRNELAKAL